MLESMARNQPASQSICGDQPDFGGKTESKEQQMLTLMRQNTMTRDNYNFFVGDNEYRKDFFLQF